MIEVVDEGNLGEILYLIRAYQEFYEISDIDDERNRTFFSQFGEQNPFGCQFLYRLDGRAVGFATVYLTFNSTIAQKVGVMNDLYVVPHLRGKGIGKALINYCLDFALSKGAYRLQWVTATDNHPAQKLYDSLNTTKRYWAFYTYRN
jgi:GNAT superfamily N-acetyltransferase